MRTSYPPLGKFASFGMGKFGTKDNPIRDVEPLCRPALAKMDGGNLAHSTEIRNVRGGQLGVQEAQASSSGLESRQILSPTPGQPWHQVSKLVDHVILS